MNDADDRDLLGTGEDPDSGSLDRIADGALVVRISLPGTPEEVSCELDGFERVTQQHQFTCSTGDQFGGRWRGVPVSALLETVSLPAETTHLVVEAVDGFRACVPIRDALAGLLAIADSDGLVDSAPRFVSTGVDGTQTVKRVTRLEPVSLDPGEAPDTYEGT